MTYVTIRKYAQDSGLGAELAAQQDSVKSIMSVIPGFQAYYFVVAADGSAASVTVCDDQAGSDASTKAAATWIAENLPDLSAAPPTITAGEVVMSF